MRSGDLDNTEIEIEVNDIKSGMPSFEIPGMPGANIGMVNLGEMLGKSVGPKGKKKKMTVKESYEILIAQESDKMIEQDKIIKEAKDSTENNGIVFLDEIDKFQPEQIGLGRCFKRRCSERFASINRRNNSNKIWSSKN